MSVASSAMEPAAAMAYTSPMRRPPTHRFLPAAILLALASATPPASAQARREVVPGPGVELQRDVPYAATDNPRQTLHLLLPRERETEVLPVLVFIHGGAWRKGDKMTGLGQLGRYVSTGKYAGVSVGYRLTDEAQWPAQIHDCKAAVRWIRGNAKRLKLDPERIGVFGTSAGGHLVAMLGTSGGVGALEGELGEHGGLSSSVACVGNFFGPSALLDMSKFPSRIDHDAPDSPESQLVGGPLQKTRAVALQASPITHVSEDDPPMLHIHGTDDQLVPYQQSVALDKALREAGCESALLTVEGGGHGGFGNPEVDARLAAFFGKYLLGEEAEITSEKLPAGKRRRR